MALQQLDTTFDKRESPLEKWKSMNDEVEDNVSGGFECNICLDLVHDPVVTLCGHLYCWPCIYKWIHFHSISSQNSDQQQPQCPVCKAEVSQNTLIPLYGRGESTERSEAKAPNLGIAIPQRPPSPRCGGHMLIAAADSNPSHQQIHRRSYQQQPHPQQPYPGSYVGSSPVLSLGGTTTNMLPHSMIGEAAYARIFGNASTTLYTYPNSYNLAVSSSPRMRRQLAHADKSLSRICFFLFCCFITCLILF